MIPLPLTLFFWVRIYTPFLCFLSREDPLAFVGELVWWCWILSAFACLQSFSISPSYLNRVLAGYSNLGCRFFSFIIFSMSCHSLLAWRLFSFITLSMPCHSLVAWRVSIKRSQRESLCVLFVVFSLLLLIFVLWVWSLLIWLICVLGCFALGLSCLGLSGFLGLGWLFPSPF